MKIHKVEVSLGLPRELTQAECDGLVKAMLTGGKPYLDEILGRKKPPPPAHPTEVYVEGLDVTYCTCPACMEDYRRGKS